MFHHDIEMRWLTRRPACGHSAKSTHLRVRRLPPADLGTAGTIRGQQAGVKWRPTPTAGQLQPRYRLLPQRLARSTTPSAEIDPWIAKTLRRARTQPRRQDAHRRRDRTRGRKHSRPPAAGRNLLLRRRRPAETSSKPPPIPTPSRKPHGWSGYAALPSPIATIVHSSGRPPLTSVLPWHPPSLLQRDQRMGARRLPRAASFKHLQRPGSR